MSSLKMLARRNLIRKLLVLLFTALLLLCLLGVSPFLIKFPSKLEFHHDELRVALQYDHPLLNLTNFHYVFSANACHPEQEVKALIVVTSHSGNVQVRMAWRNGMPEETLSRLKVRRIFLVAMPKANQLGYNIVNETQVQFEAEKYMDIVQGNFLEDYHNLSYKNVMGLQWGVDFCPQAQILIKIDDDAAINLPQVLEVVTPLVQLNNGSMFGTLFAGTGPMRNETKWAVSLEEWPRSYYPDYMSGMMYVMTPAVAAKLIAALGTDFFWVDDVFVTGVGSERAKIPLVDISKFYCYKVEDLQCCLRGGGCDFFVALAGRVTRFCGAATGQLYGFSALAAWQLYGFQAAKTDVTFLLYNWLSNFFMFY